MKNFAGWIKSLLSVSLALMVCFSTGVSAYAADLPDLTPLAPVVAGQNSAPVAPAAALPNLTPLAPASLQTGVSFTPQIDGQVMVPLVVTYVGATAPGENPYISYIDQPVVAKTMEPIVLGKNLVLPSGTIFTGQVLHIEPPRRLVRNGFAIVHFESIITSKGAVIPLDAGGSPLRNRRNEMVQRVVRMSRDSLSGALVGGTVGAGLSVALILMSPGNAVGSYIVCVSGGALIGAFAGAAYGLTRKGEAAATTMARDITVSVPAAVLQKASVPLNVYEELDAPVSFKSVKMRGFTNPYRLQVEAVVANSSDFVLESSDLVLVNPQGDHLPIYFDGKSNAATNFSVPPHSVRHFFATFEPEMPEAGQRLVWYKHLTSLKEPLVEFVLP